MKSRRFAEAYLDGLFPLYYASEEPRSPDAAGFLAQLESQLTEQIVYAMRFDVNCSGKTIAADLSKTAADVVENLRTKLPRLAQLLALDLQAAMTNDPAASGYEEILLSYPGIGGDHGTAASARAIPAEGSVHAADDDGDRAQSNRNRYSSRGDD